MVTDGGYYKLIMRSKVEGRADWWEFVGKEDLMRRIMAGIREDFIRLDIEHTWALTLHPTDGSEFGR